MIIMTRIFFLAITVLLTDCSMNDISSNAACNVANPARDLPWLKAEIEAGNYAEPNDFLDYLIYKAVYNGATVLYTEICCPTCNTIPPYLKNCAGETIGQLGVSVEKSALLHATVIWRSNNGVCP
jgi:hypothetical protein